MNKLRGIVRLMVFANLIILYVIKYFIWVAFNGFKTNLAKAMQIRIQLVKTAQPILGIEIEKFGNVPTEPCLLICNHRSYIDPAIKHAFMPFMPVAKAEVEKWPIIGKAAKITGVLFVKRESKESRTNTRKAITNAIKDGHTIVIYPEGTTHINPTTIDLKKGTFIEAAQNGINIVPCAMEYEILEDAFIGDATFVPHFIKVFGKKKMRVKLIFGEPTASNNFEELEAACKKFIDEQMVILRTQWDQTANK